MTRLHRLRIVFEIVAGLLVGAVVGGLSGLLLAIIVMPRGGLATALGARAAPWIVACSLVGAAITVPLGLSRMRAETDRQTEIASELDDFDEEPDTWPGTGCDLL